jgi:hypothetical protein
MFMAHEPQIPSRQERRKVSVGSISFLILMRASRIYAYERPVVVSELVEMTVIEREITHHGAALVQVDGV